MNFGYKLLADGAYVIELEDPTGSSNDYIDVKEGSARTRTVGIAVTDGSSTDIVSVKDNSMTICEYHLYAADNVRGMCSIFGEEEAATLTKRNRDIIREIAQRTERIEAGVATLIENRKVANRIECVREKAIAYHDTVAPLMEEIRSEIDNLELLVSDELWTLPKYRELLFIR